MSFVPRSIYSYICAVQEPGLCETKSNSNIDAFSKKKTERDSATRIDESKISNSNMSHSSAQNFSFVVLALYKYHVEKKIHFQEYRKMVVPKLGYQFVPESKRIDACKDMCSRETTYRKTKRTDNTSQSNTVHKVAWLPNFVT